MYISSRVDNNKYAALRGGQSGCDGLVHVQYLILCHSCRVGSLLWYAPCRDTRI